MNLVFSTLRDNLFTVNQSEIFNSSELMREETLQASFSAPWVNEHNGLVSVVSSAYKMKFSFLLTVCISLTYMRNNKVHKTDPWGTPVSSSRVDEHTSWYSTYCWRSVFHNMLVLTTVYDDLEYRMLSIGLRIQKMAFYFDQFRGGFGPSILKRLTRLSVVF